MKMTGRGRSGWMAAAAAAAAALVACSDGNASARVAELRVCADPNNLPFSNDRLEGFENRIAELVAHDLGARVKYTWWAQRRGFIRNTLNTGACDVVMGVPASFELTAVTSPYYRSTYVFVTREDRNLPVESFDDPALRRLEIGVQLVGDDGANTPPVHALDKRGIIGKTRGYLVYGDYGKPDPTAGIIEAVANGDVDIGIVWGPIAGYFARRHAVPLRIVPVSPQIDPPFMPFVFDIAMGVRREDAALRSALDSVLIRRQVEIAAILDEYSVPRVGTGSRSTALVSR